MRYDLDNIAIRCEQKQAKVTLPNVSLQRKYNNKSDHHATARSHNSRRKIQNLVVQTSPRRNFDSSTKRIELSTKAQKKNMESLLNVY